MKVHVDEAQAVARYGIRSTPTIGTFRDGEAIDGVEGAVPEQLLIQAIVEGLSD